MRKVTEGEKSEVRGGVEPFSIIKTSVRADGGMRPPGESKVVPDKGGQKVMRRSVNKTDCLKRCKVMKAVVIY